MAFFTDWATWEKLVFILGCAIVVTVLLGCAKLGHTHYKLRKYNADAEVDRKEGAMHRQMSRRRTQRTSREVPFGIRAIESGIEVEGVWISRSNTPELPRSRDSSISSMWLNAPRGDVQGDLERQSGDPDPSRPRSRMADGRSFEQYRVAAPGEITKRAGSQHPPSSYAKYSGRPATSLQSTSSSGLAGVSGQNSGLDAGSMGDAANRSSQASSRPNSHDANMDAMSFSALDLAERPQRPRQQSVEVDLMQSHRLSLAAETGQFTPRVRRPGANGDWTNITYNFRPSTATGSGEFRRLRARSQSPNIRPATASGAPTEYHPHKQEVSAFRDAARRISLPDVTPFAQFCKTAPSSPQWEPRKPRLASSSGPAKDGPEIHGYNPATRPSSSRSTSTTSVHDAIAGATDPRTPPPPPQPNDKRESTILRGHGSGFEILRPGTFAAERQRSAPPISMYNNDSTSRARSGSADSRRKLQKKRRSSIESTSSSGGRLSRASML